MSKHDATNPDGVVWMDSPALMPADTMKITPLSNGVVAVTFGVQVGDVVAPVAAIVMPSSDATSIGASMLRLARRRKPATDPS